MRFARPAALVEPVRAAAHLARAPSDNYARVPLGVSKPVGAAAWLAASPLAVSSPADPSEREAETIAARVMAMRAPPSAAGFDIRAGSSALARLPAPAKSTAPAAPVAAPAKTTAEPDIEAEIRAAGPGAPLPQAVLTFMTPRFGADFSQVRIHTSPLAARLAVRLQARAFTFGRTVFFGQNQFQPATEDGRALIAHELTHTIQQRQAVQRWAIAAVTVRSPPQLQRWSVGDALQSFADKANVIPGFRLMTILLGANPITMQPVEPSAANLIRAAVEFIPGGGLLVQALDHYGLFEKGADWIAGQLRALCVTATAIKVALDQFLAGLSLSDVLHLDELWGRAQQILSGPIARIKSALPGVADGAIKLIKDAVLAPLAGLAEQSRAWPLLTALLGRNPITNELVPRTAETLVGGFMKLIGQDEIWENLKRARAAARAMAWFEGASATLLGFVQRLPAVFLEALRSFVLADLLDLTGALGRVMRLFGDFAGRFITWAGEAVWKLIEIIFDTVSPGALGYIKRTGAALRSILQNPLPFVGNLVRAAKLGLLNFASRIGTHLKTGLIDWLTGALPDVYAPQAFSLVEIGKFALSVLGISWAHIRGKIVKALGPTGEAVMRGLEGTLDVVVALAKGGPAAAWEIMKNSLGQLKDMVVDEVIGFVTDTIIKKAIPKLVAMFIPGAGFISAIVSIYDTVMVFVEKLSKIMAAVTAFIDSIVAIAAGQVEGAANKVETTIAGLLSLAISFLSGFLGLGNISVKVREVIEKVRGVVDKALDTAIGWIVGKAIVAKLSGGAPQKAAAGREKTAPGAACPATATLPFAMQGHAHTLTVTIDQGGLHVVMASTPGSLYGKIEILKGQLASKPGLSPTERSKLVVALTGLQDELDINRIKDADAADRRLDHTRVDPSPKFIQNYTRKIIAIIVYLANDAGFTDLLANSFMPSPLPTKRYIPKPVLREIRRRLYERGSDWPSVRDTVFREGIKAIDGQIQNRIVIPAAAGKDQEARTAMIKLKAEGKVLTGATLADFKPATSYVSTRTGDYEVDHTPSVAEHWIKQGNMASDAVRHQAVEGKTSELELVTKRSNRSKGSMDAEGERHYIMTKPWISPPFTSASARDIHNTPNNVDAITIDGYSLTAEDGAPFVPTG